MNNVIVALSNEEMTKINFVDFEKLYNFVVEKFFIWIHLGPQKLLRKTDLPRAKKIHTAKSLFAECQKKTLGKDVFYRVFLFAECIFLALDKHGLCRVPDKIHSAKPPALGKSPVSGSDSDQLIGVVWTLGAAWKSWHKHVALLISIISRVVLH